MFTAIARLVLGPARPVGRVPAWIVLTVVLVPVGADIDGEAQNDTESTLPSGLIS